MTLFTSNILFGISILAVIGQIFVLFSALLFVTSKESPKKVASILPNTGWLWIAFFTALISTIGSLYFSVVVGFEVCKFCWFQRIFMYSQVLVLGAALWHSDFRVKRYAIPLCVVGSAFALLHLFEQGSGSDLFACGATGVSCAKVYFTQFGYITFPVLALSSFLIIIVATSYASSAISSKKI